MNIFEFYEWYYVLGIICINWISYVDAMWRSIIYIVIHDFLFLGYFLSKGFLFAIIFFWYLNRLGIFL